MIWRALLFAGLTCPTLAAAEFTIPAGCEGLFTVQQQGCRLTHIWQCPDDAQEGLWQAEIGAFGPEFVQHENANGNPNVAFFIEGLVWSKIQFNLQDGFDAEQLWSTGQDTISGNIYIPALDKSADISFVLNFEGTTETHDGLTFKVVKSRAVMSSPDLFGGDYSVTGVDLYNPEIGMFVSVETEELEPDYELSVNPIQNVFRPGEPGFHPLVPVHDCDVQTSMLGDIK